MAVAENGSPLQYSVLPAKRKCCNICEKFVYFHQPILLCGKCENVFHGACLKLKNCIIFDLQCTNWNCNGCARDNNLKCNSCCTSIFVSHEKFNICKNCSRPVHVTCSFAKSCLKCVPEYVPKINDNHNVRYMNDTSISVIDRDYYDNLPIFNPFGEIDGKMSHHFTEGDEVFENFELNSKILESCSYYSITQLSQKMQSLSLRQKFTLLGLNIDGFRSNFDKFRIFNYNIAQTGIKPSLYSFCETNVTLEESKPFSIPGYNKFILDRIMHETSNKYKHKGSGIAVYLDQKYTTAYKNESLCICTPDVEILTVSFSINDHTYNILSVYRPPNGSAENFIDNFETILNNASSRKTHITVIGDFNFNLYNPSHKYVQSYLECIFSNGVHPIISRATHFQSLNPSCIDHILTNKIDEILCTGVIPYTISHHMFTFAIVSIDELISETKKIDKNFVYQ